MSVVTIPAINCGQKRLSLFWPQARESEDWERHTHRRSFIVFHVFDFIVTYLSLLQFAPWIVDRPHGGCWRWGGDKRDNGSSFRLRRRRKKAHCCWGPPPTSTLILHGCAFFFTLADSMAGDKSSSPFFFLFSSTWWRFFLFFLSSLSKVQTSEGKMTFDITFSWCHLCVSVKRNEGYGKGRQIASLWWWVMSSFKKAWENNKSDKLICWCDPVLVQSELPLLLLCEKNLYSIRSNCCLAHISCPHAGSKSQSGNKLTLW